MIAFSRVFLPLLVAYAVTLRWVWDRWWQEDSYYSHGPLIPLIAGVVLWLGRDGWLDAPRRADARGWLLLGPALAAHLAGAALMIDSVSAASLALALPGAVWLALGPIRLRKLAPVLGLFLLAIPLPIFVRGRVVFELKEFAIHWSLQLVNLFGLEAERRGAKIFVPGQDVPLDVADPCSGLRSLLALVTLGYCVAFFLGPPRGWRPWILLLAAAPVAILANILRIAGIVWLASWQGTRWAATTGHAWLNVGEWVFDLAVLLLLHAWLTGRVERRPA